MWSAFGDSTDSPALSRTCFEHWKHLRRWDRLRFLFGADGHFDACGQDGVHSLGGRGGARAQLDRGKGPSRSAECTSQGDKAWPPARRRGRREDCGPALARSVVGEDRGATRIRRGHDPANGCHVRQKPLQNGRRNSRRISVPLR